MKMERSNSIEYTLTQSRAARQPDIVSVLTWFRAVKHLDEADKRDYLISMSALNQILAKKEVKYILMLAGPQAIPKEGED